MYLLNIVALIMIGLGFGCFDAADQAWSNQLRAEQARAEVAAQLAEQEARIERRKAQIAAATSNR